MNIYLVGPMGSGKSAVGRQLARQLGLEFVDSDDEIEARTGVDISYIFEREGEAGFRRASASDRCADSSRDSVIVSTGGGAVLDPADPRAPPQPGAGSCIFGRPWTSNSHAPARNDRPLLNNPDPRGTLERLLRAAPLYREVADCVVDRTAAR